ncbi:MAG: S9 family peptidase [Deltaproteobacteria bacterium]|jgi:oligopeptidase B|nr:S9 family peptidase [Deltaproteobacteria bacterium]MBW2533047.1 S9 family peptidase [Deltaproteobacteria bacterium]
MERHGHTRVDEYFWLRRRDDPRVLAHLRSENAYASRVLRPWVETTRRFYQEIRSRLHEADMDVPEKIGSHYYYWKRRAGRAHAAFARKRGALHAKEQVLLDLDGLARQRQVDFLRIGCVAVSPDQRLLAYAADFAGDERYQVFVQDLETGEHLLDTIHDAHTSLAWANDSATFCYVRLNPIGQPRTVLLHRLGTSPRDDQPIYDERDDQFFVSCSKAKSGRLIFIEAASNVSTEVHYLDAGDPGAPLRCVWPHEPGVVYRVVHHGDCLYVLTNKDAPNFRLVRAPLQTPSQFEDFVPHREDRLLEGVEEFASYLALFERKDGLRRVRFISLPKGQQHTLTFPEASYSVTENPNPEFDSRQFRFSYSSLLTPPTVYDYDMKRRLRRVRKFTEVKGGFDPGNYQLRRIFAAARDGQRVPISLLHRRGLRRNGKNPLYITGYGAYGDSEAPVFSPECFSLVDRGFVYAMAHVRGGQEMGRNWYEQGKLLNKKATFTDFIDCTEHLVREQYTSPGLAVAAGTSAGGLLVGAVANMRPDLYRAIIADVPFVDVLNSMMDPSQPLTAVEYDEWGDPADREHYEYMASYSPYDNVTCQAYPNVLAFAALNDPRVPYWEAAKWVARLRDRKTNDAVVLLRTALRAGHWGRSSRFDRARQTALEYAFIFMTLGIEPEFDED